MNYSDWKRKALVLTVIYLFIGVAFAPGITASKEISGNIDLNSDLVEVTVEAGNRDHSVLLTPDQAMELENLIDLTKNRLDATYTMEETSKVFDEIVVSLYEMGMLPDGMSVRDVQRLVKGVNQYARIGALNAVSTRNPSISDNRTNMVCLIAGETDHTYMVGLPIYVLLLYSMVYEYLIFPHRIFEFFLVGTLWISFFIKLVIPLSLADAIYLGIGDLTVPYRIIPASGWVYTNGLNGVKRWEGDLYGNLPPFGRLGVYGFFGIKIIKDYEYFYLGTAVWVKIREEPPTGV